MTHENLIERQLERERNQVDAGAKRYHRMLQTKEAGETRPGMELVTRAVMPVANAIRDLIARVESGKAGKGRPVQAVRYLQQLQPEPVAFITARALLHAACTGAKATKTAMAIASMLEEHYQFDELRSEARGLSNVMEKKAKKWSTPFHRRAIMRTAAKVAEVSGLEWKQGEKLHLGMRLIEIFVETTGLAELVLANAGRANSAYTLRASAQTSEWLARMHERCSLLDPVCTPMIVPPRDWTNPVDGGYLTHENRLDFMSGISPEFRDELFSVEMPDVYRAVNAIQRTEWKINVRILDLVKEAWASGSELGGLPAREDRPVPVRPADIPSDLARDAMSAEMRKRLDEWRGEAAEAYAKNASLISQRLSTNIKLGMAQDVAGEAAIYFPHTLDFRGRTYPAVTGMHPQADDLGKALLLFAKGKPLGESGAYWLHVHLANLFGVDDCSFDDRVAWVQEHSELLLDSAFDPLDGQRFWDTAEEPWQALAACFEYAGWSIEGTDYVSHLPVPMDGKCSGVQHYTGMLLDEEAAKYVCLVPMDKPADLYMAVVHRTEQLLLEETDQLAISWRGNVKRKVAKRPCMTFAYSVTSRGMRDQIADEIHKQAKGGQYLPGWTNFESATFLAPRVEAAIRSTVRRAAEAMDWLQEAIKPVVQRNEPVIWFTADGLPIQHRYVRTNGKRFSVWVQGVRMQIQLRVDGSKQDVRKHQSSIAPNYIHGNDATHLRMVVNRLMDAGVTDSFAMIHDSFGVHACDVDELHYAIRDEFIKLYTPNRLEEFREQMCSLLDPADWAEIPTPPERGDLDLELVRGADFFFG